MEKFYENGWTLEALKSYYKGIFDIKDFKDLGGASGADANASSSSSLPFPFDPPVQHQPQPRSTDAGGLSRTSSAHDAQKASSLSPDTGNHERDQDVPDPKSETGGVLYKLSSLLREADDDLFNEENDDGNIFGETSNAGDGGSTTVPSHVKVVHSGWADVQSSISSGTKGSGRKWLELSEITPARAAGNNAGPTTQQLVCRSGPRISADEDEPFVIDLGSLSLVNRRGDDDFDVYTKKGISTITVQSKQECDKWVSAIQKRIDRLAANHGSAARGQANQLLSRSQAHTINTSGITDELDDTLDGALSQNTEAVCEGWLFKSPVERPGSSFQGAKPRGRWLRRWFTLVGRTLEYRTSEEAEQAKGTLILADGAVCREVDNEKMVFELSSVAGTVSLQAESVFDKQMWFSALRGVCKIETISDQTFRSLRDDSGGLRAGDMSPAVSVRSSARGTPTDSGFKSSPGGVMGTVAKFKTWQQTRHDFYDLLNASRISATNVSHALTLVKDPNMLPLTREFSQEELSALCAKARAHADSGHDRAGYKSNSNKKSRERPSTANTEATNDASRRPTPPVRKKQLRRKPKTDSDAGVDDLSDPADADAWVDKCALVFTDWDRASMNAYREAGWSLQALVDYRMGQDPSWKVRIGTAIFA